VGVEDRLSIGAMNNVFLAPSEIGPVADRFDHRIRVLGEAGGVFLARKIRRHDVTTSFPQFCQMPVPADVAGTVDQTYVAIGHPSPARGLDAKPRLHSAGHGA
jgi:hypothetical protein